MCDKKCPPLVAAIIGFVLGAIVVKLVERFCPGRCCCGDAGGCCCGESDCCSDEGGEPEEGCCCGDAAASSSGEEPDSPAE
jgi:hypothetical protein